MDLFDRLFPDEHHHQWAYHRELQRLTVDSQRILDLGCGANVDLAPYREAAREVWGVDFDEHPRLEHRDWFRRLESSGRIPFPDEYFDVVACCWVLEHVRDPGHFLSEVSRVLRPGGAFIAHTASASHYVTWVRRALTAFPHWFIQRLIARTYGREPDDTFPTYYRLNRARDLERYGRRSGLEVRELFRYADQGYFRLSRWAYGVAVRADWMLEQLRPGAGRLYMTVVYHKPVARSAA